MTVSNIAGSLSAQPTLTALTNTQNLLQATEDALATGQAVNSPTENASAYYTAQSFLEQANSLSNLKDNLSTSLTTIGSTVNSIGSVTQVVNQLQGIVTEAADTTDTALRNNLASQYNALLPQLDSLVSDSTFNGTNLLNGSSNPLTVYFDAGNSTSLSVPAVNVTSSGLNISDATNGFASSSDIASANAQLSQALSTLDNASASFGSNATLVQTRQDFTSSMINSLQDAASNLTMADVNQEAANLQALQAGDQLGIVSLSISGQMQSAILKLF